MPEPERLESQASTDPAGRDSRAEILLVEGLDHYFAGRYEDAIHVWTRVLFLDRTHSRARAYIDRARTAIAERQRRADELIEASNALLGQGRTVAARRLFNEVVAQAGEDERAAALRLRLERLEQFERLSITPPREVALKPSTSPARVPVSVPANRRRRTASVLLGLTALAICAGALFGPDARDWFDWQAAGPDLVTQRPVPVPPPLSTSDVALIRAETAFKHGRLAEALQALDRVSVDSPVFAEADRLRVHIQQTLLASTIGRSRTEARVP